jgi:hypothetical protein
MRQRVVSGSASEPWPRSFAVTATDSPTSTFAIIFRETGDRHR